MIGLSPLDSIFNAIDALVIEIFSILFLLLLSAPSLVLLTTVAVGYRAIGLR